MTHQEQEHWDHVAGSASEFQNCFEEARIACSHQNNAHGKAIADLLAQGLFVVVEEYPYYCRATNVVAGSVKYNRGAFATRAEANDAALRIYETEDDRLGLEVLPASPRPPVEAADSENVPF